MDPGPGRGALPQRHHLPGSLSCGAMGNQRTRQGAPRDLESDPPCRPQGSGHGAERQPMGAAKNAQDLTANEAAKLALVAKLNAPLYRAYLLKEQLRLVFHVGYAEAMRTLERWLEWARRCRIGPFVALARSITYYRADIEATLLHGVTNGRVESLNTKVRLIARRAFGFRSAHALIALSELTLGGLCPPLPGRQVP